MITKTLTRLAGLCFLASMMFGALAAAERPSHAQVTMICWREICATNPDTGKLMCVREQIDCPPVQEQ